jgi:hypothetical protein
MRLGAPHRGHYERDVVHREASADGVDRVPNAFQQIGQLTLRNDGAARAQRIQPLVTREGLGPLKAPLLRLIERARFLAIRWAQNATRSSNSRV